ncbi:DUF6526 family protein [Paenibacillus sp. HJGM_3]|uniref:DUF6526 family protein n=1 Tax=Paenibacillus sp. HJGM_3 TaxID=3379816 RepID=UPI00385E0D77
MSAPAPQTYANHRRLHPLFHFVLSLLVVAVLVGSLIYLVRSLADNGQVGISLLFMGIACALVILFLLVRSYAAKVQDRAIRAEEQLRHFVLTGRLLDPRLTMRQIIALRFAGDEEFPALSQRAAEEQLAPDAIKRAVREWRGDYHRV